MLSSKSGGVTAAALSPVATPPALVVGTAAPAPAAEGDGVVKLSLPATRGILRCATALASCSGLGRVSTDNGVSGTRVPDDSVFALAAERGFWGRGSVGGVAMEVMEEVVAGVWSDVADPVPRVWETAVGAGVTSTNVISAVAGAGVVAPVAGGTLPAAGAAGCSCSITFTSSITAAAAAASASARAGVRSLKFTPGRE